MPTFRVACLSCGHWALLDLPDKSEPTRQRLRCMNCGRHDGEITEAAAAYNDGDAAPDEVQF